MPRCASQASRPYRASGEVAAWSARRNGWQANGSGEGGRGGDAHRLTEWYESTGREIGYQRALLLILAMAGTALCVRTMNGSNVVVAVMLLIVLAGLLVPHQLLVTVAVA